jgi:hypothetical protein
LRALFHAPIFDLDLIHWKDDGLGTERDEDAAIKQKVADLGRDRALGHRGVYGWLAEVRATALT